MNKKIGTIVTAACILGVCGFTMVGMPKVFATTLDTPKTVNVAAGPSVHKDENVNTDSAADVTESRGKITKEKAIEIVKDYVAEYKYAPETFEKYSIKFVASTSPASPDKWIMAFGDVDAVTKYRIESEKRIAEEERTGNYATEKGDDGQGISAALYAEVNATTGEVITQFETYDTNGLTSQDK